LELRARSAILMPIPQTSAETALLGNPKTGTHLDEAEGQNPDRLAGAHLACKRVARRGGADHGKRRIFSFAMAKSLYDVAVMLVLGLFGWLLESRGMPVAPLILGLLLGETPEQTCVQNMCPASAPMGPNWQFE
jgi:hypothetical protein